MRTDSVWGPTPKVSGLRKVVTLNPMRSFVQCRAHLPPENSTYQPLALEAGQLWQTINVFPEEEARRKNAASDINEAEKGDAQEGAGC